MMRTKGDLVAMWVERKEQILEMFYWHLYYEDQTSLLACPGNFWHTSTLECRKLKG